MLKITQEPRFRHEVTVTVPTAGGFTKETITVTYRVLTVGRVSDYRLDTVEGTTEFLKDVVVKLEDVVDDAGKPLTYSDDVRDQAIEIPYVRAALIDAYFKGVRGAVAGN